VYALQGNAGAGSKAVSFASITNEVLARAAQFQHDKARSASHACPVPQPRAAVHAPPEAQRPSQSQAGPPPPPTPTPQAPAEMREAEAAATDFLRTVEYCSGTAEHTRFHSRQSAVKNFAVSNAHGKATYWYMLSALSLYAVIASDMCVCVCVCVCVWIG
jgi:hypothetical protein